MKFKSQAKQNQLIENITSSHLVVGIDIAQQIHVARAVNFRGIILGEPLSFTNDEDGFRNLHNWIRKLQVAHHCRRGYGTDRSLLAQRVPMVSSA